MRATALFSALFVLASLSFGTPSAPGEAATLLTIDATATREPISPYVYGQFMEHVGRCIYGGFWAEMLEDRKFFYPVDGRTPAWTLFTPGLRSWDGEGHPYELLTRSPWMILGELSAVSMDTDTPFVGEHSPQILLPGDGERGGIMQDGLSLGNGRRYVGRVVLAGTADADPVEVSLVWGHGASERVSVRFEGLGAEFATFPFELRAGGSIDAGRLEIASRGRGSFRIGTVSLMPADNVHGWRAETLAVVKQLGSPVYRWPGGNFVSGYDWKDGIGDRDRRPPRKNPAWKGIEPNDVGLHEYMDLMREIDAEPFVTVNTGLGQATSAAEQVQYANGSSDTRMGRLRAENGHSQPFGIRWWAIGNEMYGDWQLGHMPLADYVEKHKRVVETMREVDPSLRAIAVGSMGEWSRTMLATAADHMDLISEHLYWQDKDDLSEHVFQIRDGIRSVADAHRGYRKELLSLESKDIRIALDEWNYWYGAAEYGELGVRYFLQDALGIAVGLHEMFRHSDLFYMANYAQTVDFLGAVKTTGVDAELEATGLALALYRHQFGTVPVAVAGDLAPLDVAAAWTEDRTALTVAVVNPTDGSRRLRLDVRGAEPTGLGRRFVLTGADRWAHNAPGRPRGVDLHQTSLREGADEILVPPLSVTLQVVRVRSEGVMRDSHRTRPILLIILSAAGMVLPVWPGPAVAQTVSDPDSGTESADRRQLIGVKIYEPVPDAEALFQEWTRLGIDTAFVSAAIAESGSFIPAARRAGLRTLVVTPVFYNPEYLEENPDAWAITGRGERAREDWVEFVCPSHENYRQQRIREALSILRKTRPDGLSLDFVRHFVFWEMVGPEENVDPLDTTCFCPHCLGQFQRKTGVALPEEAASAPGAAEWLFAHQREAWIRWRAGLITSWVRDLAREARRIAPHTILGVHVVPWGRDDYGDGLLRVAGQDVEALAPLVDYLSPMCYAHMLHREPEWVGRVARELAGRVTIPVLPSIEVKESYRSEELTDAFFGAALRAALRPPSDGVVFWSWPPLAASASKREIVARRGR